MQKPCSAPWGCDPSLANAYGVGSGCKANVHIAYTYEVNDLRSLPPLGGGSRNAPEDPKGD